MVREPESASYSPANSQPGGARLGSNGSEPEYAGPDTPAFSQSGFLRILSATPGCGFRAYALCPPCVR